MVCAAFYFLVIRTTRRLVASIENDLPCGAIGSMGRNCSLTKSLMRSGKFPFCVSHCSKASFNTSKLSSGLSLINLRATSSAGDSSSSSGDAKGLLIQWWVLCVLGQHQSIPDRNRPRSTCIQLDTDISFNNHPTTYSRIGEKSRD